MRGDEEEEEEEVLGKEVSRRKRSCKTGRHSK